MARLTLLVGAAALAVLCHSSSARAETPGGEAGPALPGGVMRVLDALAVVGVAQIDKSSVLISPGGVRDTSRLPVRAPTWAAPEEPPKPLFYSRVVQLTF